MEPSSRYLTLYPSKSTTRSILAEPMEQASGTLGQSQLSSQQSQEPQESGLMQPNSTYPTLYPSTSTTRSILTEPMKNISTPFGHIQEPLEQSQFTMMPSQKPQKQASVQEHRKWLEETMERIVELKTMNKTWYEIVEEVKLPEDECIEIWDYYCHRLARDKATLIPETSRRFKSWTQSEDEILVNLRKAGCGFHEMGGELVGRSKHACKSRYEKLCAKGKTS